MLPRILSVSKNLHPSEHRLAIQWLREFKYANPKFSCSRTGDGFEIFVETFSIYSFLNLVFFLIGFANKIWRRYYTLWNFIFASCPTKVIVKNLEISHAATKNYKMICIYKQEKISIVNLNFYRGVM